MERNTRLGNKYIFIAGSPRSGTSLLQKMLNNHSKIYGGSEFMHLIQICRLYDQMLIGITNKRQKTYYNEEELINNIRSFINNIFLNKIEKANVKFLSEKTPTNLLVFDTLAKIFPNAKFIIIIRNPMGVLNSYQKVAKRGKEINIKIPIGNNIYKDLNQILKYNKLASIFLKNNSIKPYLIYYEDIIQHPVSEMKKLSDFIGVDYEDIMLNTELENENSKLIQLDQAKPWYTKEMYDSVINKNKGEEWKNDLSKKDIIIANHFFHNNNLDIIKRYNFISKNKLLYYCYRGIDKIKKNKLF